jgi:hypothetical protein
MLAAHPKRKPALRVVANNDAKTFTSWKLDLQRCLLADPRLKPADKVIAVCILQHVNAKTRQAFVSAETISDETCIGVRHIVRAIRHLKETGWLKTRKTTTANLYEFSDRNANKMLDRLLIQRDARAAKRARKRQSARTPESEHKPSARTYESESARTRESDIHLSGTP